MRKNVYILSDAHLGSWAIDHKRQQERRLVRFLDEIKDRAAAVYLLGDMFDFWYEWRYTVPKGYTRFLGKLSGSRRCPWRQRPQVPFHPQRLPQPYMSATLQHAAPALVYVVRNDVGKTFPHEA